ncbi:MULTISPECIES: hypothetical protein [Leptospira]|uniref:Uncharacterized protein n=6 Tax=Leptospira borgpetersenii TaxID=174 RepID=M3HPM3_LEPBO|nr:MULTISPECIES: hypothetical protein [Leptospira]APY24971.1 Uncharacterized protein LB4E_1782 [Leptospira borgpetersenii str. 4E]EMF99589.1 hypothetical protein LEP1GSC123_2943 [Leptospira borgpetersenii str. 200701203]EMN14840.1 hypothetical protein LEP1GSC055_0461 [Leptospira borgpetersenii str. Brem 307]EMN17928.1 hypothetical protein LEP1GSC056_0430 [Leptospira borgpetersenii str. Brem 328]EMO11279.1 hypothetical protein LEP1GSC137_3437 [Leptospira borgpetersenii str. Noumea 25]
MGRVVARFLFKKRMFFVILKFGSFFDFIAAFPFELVAQKIFGIDLSSHPYLFLFFGTTRIVKIVRVPTSLHRFNLAFKPASGVLRLVLLGFWIRIVAHWCAVGWLYMDELDSTKTG